MKIKLPPVAFLVASTLVTTASSAATITLVPSETEIEQGDTVTVDIQLDFADVYQNANGTVGGGIDISFDTSKLDFVSYQSANVGDAGFQRNPDVNEAAGTLTGIAAGGIGESDGANSSPALGANDVIGTLTFQSTGTGSANISGADNTTPAGGFYDFNANNIVTSYQGASITISEPVPACRADIDGDGSVLIGDFAIFRSEFGRQDCSEVSPCRADIDGDGSVLIGDFAIFRSEFGRQDCPTQ